MLLLLVVLMAPPPTPTPTPVAPPAPITILRARGGSANQPVPRGNTLADVAAKVRLKLPSDHRRLDNEAVGKLATGVELTMAKSDGVSAASGSTNQGDALARGGKADADKAIWQQRYQSARARVSQLKADIQRLEKQERELANQFYSWDDPNYRDGVIKPKWDQVKVVLEKTRTDLGTAQLEPDAVMEAARRAGGEPGWFRELPEPRPDDFAAPSRKP